jgi:DNA-binding NarL/FixJ family response regulator
MSTDVNFTEENSTISILCANRYRAESLAGALMQHLHGQTVSVSSANDVPTDATIVLVDLDLGMESALQVIQSIASRERPARIVILGLVESEEAVLTLAGLGVAGYVLSDATLAELLSVVQAVRRGEFVCRPEITYALFSHLTQLASGGRHNSLNDFVLTVRERQIFRLMAERLMNKEIAARLFLSEHTVKNHVHHILKKLGLRNRSCAVHARVYVPEAAFVPLKSEAR